MLVCFFLRLKVGWNVYAAAAAEGQSLALIEYSCSGKGKDPTFPETSDSAQGANVEFFFFFFFFFFFWSLKFGWRGFFLHRDRVPAAGSDARSWIWIPRRGQSVDNRWPVSYTYTPEPPVHPFFHSSSLPLPQPVVNDHPINLSSGNIGRKGISWLVPIISFAVRCLASQQMSSRSISPISG